MGRPIRPNQREKKQRKRVENKRKNTTNHQAQTLEQDGEGDQSAPGRRQYRGTLNLPFGLRSAKVS